MQLPFPVAAFLNPFPPPMHLGQAEVTSHQCVCVCLITFPLTCTIFIGSYSKNSFLFMLWAAQFYVVLLQAGWQACDKSSATWEVCGTSPGHVRALARAQWALWVCTC